jgi:hypothetical protein
VVLPKVPAPCESEGYHDWLLLLPRFGSGHCQLHHAVLGGGEPWNTHTQHLTLLLLLMLLLMLLLLLLWWRRLWMTMLCCIAL